MKTNANAKSVIKAVENVSANMYDRNVVFRKYPEKLTKNVIRFTLRTKDATKAGSLITKAGQHQPKANWEVHQNVMQEIFALNPRPNVYVDTIFGRQFNENPVLAEQPELIDEASNSNENGSGDEPEAVVRTKRKYTKHAVAIGKRKYTKRAKIKAKRKYTKKNGQPSMTKLMAAFKHVLAHPELMKA